MNPAPADTLEKRQATRRKKPCAREGCERTVTRSRAYCCSVCAGIENEFSRLQSLYETAGDPTLSRDAWTVLVDVSDQWTEFVRDRGSLYKDIAARGLPTPTN